MLFQDPEIFEWQNPIYLLQHEFWTDSAGPGKWRGGLGKVTVVKYYGEESLAVLHGDGTLRGPYGLFGGMEGALNRVEIHYVDGSVHVCKAREITGVIPPGSVSMHFAGGGGGYGDPLERDVDRVVEDAKNGLVSLESARRDYGVVIDPTTLLADTEATRLLRAERRPQATRVGGR